MLQRCREGALFIGLLLILSAGFSGNAFAQDDQAPIQVLEPRKNVQEFSLPDLNGKMVNLKDFRGKVVFVNFWATWCPPCRDEMPSMEQIYREYRDKGLVMLGINFMEPPSTIKPFIETHKLTFPILLDSGTVMVLYGVLGLPATYLIDRQGKAAARALGARDWTHKESVQIIRKLLDEK
jgi:peroxiredoxin